MYTNHNPYKYRYINTTPLKGKNGPVEKIVYSFKNIEDRKFIVHVDRYILPKSKRNMYAVKFFQNKDKNLGPKKFQKILNIPDSRAVLKTCIQVLLDTWEKDKYACFAVHGVCTPEDLSIKTKKGEYQRNNKTSRRFNIYKNFVARYFNEDQFHISAKDEYNSIVVFSITLDFEGTKMEIQDEILNRHPNSLDSFRLGADDSSVLFYG